MPVGPMAVGFLGLPWHWLMAGGVLVVLGGGLLWAARRADWKNWIIESATPLPIRLVNPRDDVWIRGKAACESPLVVTHFGHACLHFTYKLDERVRRTRTDKDGKTETYYEWVTRERDSGAADFAIVDGEDRLMVQGAQASFDGESSETDRQGDWRHSCRYLPYPCKPSAIGVPSAARSPPRVATMANSRRPSSAGFHPMPASSVRPKMSPLGELMILSADNRRRPCGPGARVRTW